MAASPHSAGRASGGAAARGLVIVAVAVVIGLLLLRTTVDDPVEAGTEAVETATVTETEVETPTDGDETTNPDPATDPDGTDPETAVDPTPVDVRPTEEVNVQVANAGTGVAGAAGRVTDTFQTLGYVTGTPTNTLDLDLPGDSVVHFESGYLAEATIVAQELGLGPDAVQPLPTADPASLVDSYENPNILILLGANQAPAG